MADRDLSYVRPRSFNPFTRLRWRLAIRLLGREFRAVATETVAPGMNAWVRLGPAGATVEPWGNRARLEELR